MSKFHHQNAHPIIEIGMNIHHQHVMMDFYHDVLGLEVINQNSDVTVLGFESPLVTLHHEINYPLSNRKEQGLYHMAFLVPSKEDFSSILKLLIQKRYPLTGLSDHGVSWALYLNDPEGNGIEIYVDLETSKWPMKHGKLEMVTQALDLNHVLSYSHHAAKLSKHTIIGHIHLSVSNVMEAGRFYQETFQYHVMQQYGPHALFLSDGTYHHFLGINAWLGHELPQRDLSKTGLRSYTLWGEEKEAVVDEVGVTVYFKSQL